MKNGWEIKRIGDVCQLMTGGTPSRTRPEYFGGPIKWLVSGDIHQKEIFECEGRITEEGMQNSNAKLLPVDSVMIALNGQGKTRGTVAMLRTLATCNQSLVSISPRDPSRLLSEFLYANLHGRYQEIRQMTGDSGNDRRGLNMDLIRNIEVPIAPVSEQKRIVGILNKAFEIIAIAKAKAEKNLQNARALFESHLETVFTKRGDGWTEKRLGEICERVSVGHVGPTSKFYCEPDKGIPFIRSQNVRRTRLDWDGIQYITKEFHQQLRKSQLLAGDLLFVRVGANRGDCCSVPNDVGEINCANIVFARPREGNATFLEHYCGSTHGRNQLLGMTTGSAQGVINTSSVAELVVPLAPISKQRHIVDSLNELQTETQRLTSVYDRKITTLEALKKSLLHQAFTGKL
ncbi:MAG TPA: restriction endonuclease subunit S [Candidatus Angelobacter sp.]